MTIVKFFPALFPSMVLLQACAVAPISELQTPVGRHTLKDLRDQYVVKQQEEYSCGAAALATLLTYYYGNQTAEEELLHILQDGLTPEQKLTKIQRGFSLLDLKQAAVAKGYRAGGFRLTFEQLFRLKAPVIAFVETRGYKHFTVLRTVEKGNVFMADPARGNVRMPFDQFLDEWRGIVLVLGVDDEESLKGQPLLVANRKQGHPELDRLDAELDLGNSLEILPQRLEYLILSPAAEGGQSAPLGTAQTAQAPEGEVVPVSFTEPGMGGNAGGLLTQRSFGSAAGTPSVASIVSAPVGSTVTAPLIGRTAPLGVAAASPVLAPAVPMLAPSAVTPSSQITAVPSVGSATSIVGAPVTSTITTPLLTPTAPIGAVTAPIVAPIAPSVGSTAVHSMGSTVTTVTAPVTSTVTTALPSPALPSTTTTAVQSAGSTVTAVTAPVTSTVTTALPTTTVPSTSVVPSTSTTAVQSAGSTVTTATAPVTSTVTTATTTTGSTVTTKTAPVTSTVTTPLMTATAPLASAPTTIVSTPAGPAVIAPSATTATVTAPITSTITTATAVAPLGTR
jgi:uncharacterized protein